MKRLPGIVYMLLSGSIVLFSCKKDGGSQQELNYLPKKIVRTDLTGGSGTAQLEFVYNDRQLIAEIKGNFDTDGFTSATFEYDNGDKLTKAIRYRGTEGTIYEFEYVGLTPVTLINTLAGSAVEYPIATPATNVYTMDDLRLTFNNQGDLVSSVTEDGDILMQLQYKAAEGIFHSAKLPQPAMTITGLYLGLLDMLFLAKNEITDASGGTLSLGVSNTRDDHDRITAVRITNNSGGAVLYEFEITY